MYQRPHLYPSFSRRRVTHSPPLLTYPPSSYRPLSFKTLLRGREKEYLDLQTPVRGDFPFVLSHQLKTSAHLKPCLVPIPKHRAPRDDEAELRFAAGLRRRLLRRLEAMQPDAAPPGTPHPGLLMI